jgi:type I restriction enzyme S subunit
LSEVFENEEWENEKIWNIIDFNYGKWLDKSQRSDFWSYPVYGANGIMNYSEQYLFEWESIIVWRKWSAWAITKVSWKFRPSDVTYYITLKKQGNMDFIHYLLSTLNLPSYAQWVKPWINRNTIYDLDIKYPDLTTQTHIVSQLDDLSQNISSLRSQYTAQLQHFDDLRASILDQAFTWKLESL